MLGTHPIDDTIWSYDNESVNSCDSIEELAGMHTIWDGYDKSEGTDDHEKKAGGKIPDNKANTGLIARIEVPGRSDNNDESTGNNVGQLRLHDTDNGNSFMDSSMEYEDDLHMFLNDGDEDNFSPDGDVDKFYDSHEEILDDSHDELNTSMEVKVTMDTTKTSSTKVEKTASKPTTKLMPTAEPSTNAKKPEKKGPSKPQPTTRVNKLPVNSTGRPMVATNNATTALVPADCDGKPLCKYDKVKILTKGRWKAVKNSIGKLIHFGEGTGDQTWVTVSVPHIYTPQRRIAKNLKFVSRPSI